MERNHLSNFGRGLSKERYQTYRVDTISIWKITKGNNSFKNVGGVTVVYLCMSSGHALYFYQVL